DVRLVDGPNDYRGRLEVYHDGEWGTVCDDNISYQLCIVVCKQLGYDLGGAGTYVHAFSYANESRSPIWLDEVQCFGNESKLEDCRKSNWASHNCYHFEDVGCACSYKGFSILLIPFQRGIKSRGRVEIKYGIGKWGLVCGDDWKMEELTVFCSCLGYNKLFFNIF
ncbi:hypothetical protein HELRODRAFT_89295, partial [Helobdella robusta]|uniref:SRCR domain-containing protein n=1 Tax=Helobdella robusta TaxID=6412 RepID=T1G7B7_HELRO